MPHGPGLRGELPRVTDERTIARFWAKVDQSGPPPAHRPGLGDCWLWTAGGHPGGYGSFKLRSYVQELAHRVAYAIAVEAVPAGFCVLHHCDTRRCVRPEHLYVGTQQRNMDDMIERGRHYTVTRPEAILRGERHPCARLTWAQVQEIRGRLDAGERPIAALAREYGVTDALISHIRTGRIWRRPA